MNLVASKKYALIIFLEFWGRLEEFVVSGINMLIMRPEAAPQTFALCPSCTVQWVLKFPLGVFAHVLSLQHSSTIFLCFCFRDFFSPAL